MIAGASETLPAPVAAAFDPEEAAAVAATFLQLLSSACASIRFLNPASLTTSISLASSQAFPRVLYSFLNGDSGEFLCTSLIRIAAPPVAAAAALARPLLLLLPAECRPRIPHMYSSELDSA